MSSASTSFLGPRTAIHGLSRSGSTPWLLRLVAIAMGLYALLPSLAVPPVATEGFEAAVSSGVNQPLFAPSPVPFPEFSYDSRPGEFFLYHWTNTVAHADALLVGQMWSLIAYACGLAGVVLLAGRTGLARAWVAALSYFTLFDLASNMAQVSSSNTGTGFLALGAGLFTLGGVGSVVAVLVLALAVFCRLDMLILVPFALLFSVFVQASPARFLRNAVMAGVAVGVLVPLFYEAEGLWVLDVLRAHKSVALGWSLSSLRRAFHMLPIWTLLPAVLGVSAGQWRTWREQPLLALVRAFAILAPAGVITTIYLGQMDSPRFIAPAATFLAMGTAMLIEAVIGARATVRNASFAVLTGCLALTWFARQPLQIWDGYRYKYTTYLAPFEMFREKVFLHDSNDQMYSDAIEQSCAECKQVPLEILSIEWRQFNEVVRRMVLDGARLTEISHEPLVGEPAPLVYRFDLRGRPVSIYLFERPREFTLPSQAVAAAAELDRRGDLTVLVSDPELAATMLAKLPMLSMGFEALYDRWQEHLSQINLHSKQAAQPAG